MEKNQLKETKPKTYLQVAKTLVYGPCYWNTATIQTYRKISFNYKTIKPKISELLLEAFSTGLSQLPPASCQRYNDHMLKGGWKPALSYLGGEETSLAAFIKIPVLQMDSRDLLNCVSYCEDGRGLGLLCCVAVFVEHTS